MIHHRAEDVAGPVLVDGDEVTLSFYWPECFEDGEWQPLRREDVIIWLETEPGIGVSASGINGQIVGLAAIARLISPGVHDRVRQVDQLLMDTVVEE